MSGTPQPGNPESAPIPPRENADNKDGPRARHGPYAFLEASILSLVLVIALLLAGDRLIAFYLLALGVVLGAIGLIRAKTVTEKKMFFVYISALGTLLGYLAYNLWVSEFLSGIGFFFLVAAPVLGAFGVFSSQAHEWRSGVILVVGPGLGLLVWGMIDAPLIIVPILWWGVPFGFGLAILTKTKARITSKGIALMGFASLLLPWFTDLGTHCCGYADETTNLFLTDIVQQGISVQGVRPLSYYGLTGILALPLIIAMVVAGSTIFLYENWKTQGSDLHRKRSAFSGPILIVASVIAASIFTMGYAYGFESIVRLPAAGCWLALITGSMMVAPRSPVDRGTAAIAPEKPSSLQ